MCQVMLMFFAALISFAHARQQKTIIAPGKTAWRPPTFPPTFRINATMDFPGWEVTSSGTNSVKNKRCTFVAISIVLITHANVPHHGRMHHGMACLAYDRALISVTVDRC